MHSIYSFYKNNYHKLTFIFFFVGCFICLFSFLYFSFKTEHADFMFKEMIYATENKGFDGSNSPIVVFSLILWNNLKLSLVMILLGLIPVLFLPLFTPFATFFSLGLVLAVFETKLSLGSEIFVFALFPHVLVEFFGFSLAACIGFLLSKNVFKKIFSKKRKEVFLRKEIITSAKAFLLFVLPIVFLGSLVECTVSPFLTEHFIHFQK